MKHATIQDLGRYAAINGAELAQLDGALSAVDHTVSRDHGSVRIQPERVVAYSVRSDGAIMVPSGLVERVEIAPRPRRSPCWSAAAPRPTP